MDEPRKLNEYLTLVCCTAIWQSASDATELLLCQVFGRVMKFSGGVTLCFCSAYLVPRPHGLSRVTDEPTEVTIVFL